MILREIARRLGCTLRGDGSVEIEAPLKKYRTINRLMEEVLSFLLGSK